MFGVLQEGGDVQCSTRRGDVPGNVQLQGLVHEEFLKFPHSCGLRDSEVCTLGFNIYHNKPNGEHMFVAAILKWNLGILMDEIQSYVLSYTISMWTLSAHVIAPKYF